MKIKKQITIKSIMLIPIMLICIAPILSFEIKGHLQKVIANTKPISPDIKSWAFVRKLIGGKYSDIKKDILDNGYKFIETAKSSQGTAYYYESNFKYKFDHPVFGETDEEYTVIADNDKIRGVFLQFLKTENETSIDLLDKWVPFEKAFVADGYNKTNESAKDFEIERNYYNKTQRIKMDVVIIKTGSSYQAVEISIYHEDFNPKTRE